MNLEDRIFIDDEEPKSPSHNLALNVRFNELVSSGKYQAAVRIYKHKPGVILGRMESIADVNEDYCRTNNIEIVERITGGSAVVVGPDEALCYSAFIKVQNKFDLTENYKKLVTPILEELKKRGILAEVQGAYYIRVNKGDSKPPIIGHAATVRNNAMQLDGIIHSKNLKVEQIQRILNLRQLYEFEGHKYVVAGNEVYPIVNGVPVEQMPKFRKEAGKLVRDEKNELEQIPGLFELKVSEEEFKEVLYNAFTNSLGSLREASLDEINQDNLDILKERFQKRPRGNNRGLGHCFIDLVEPEPKEFN